MEFSRAQCDMMLDLKARGAPVDQIAKAAGIPRSHVREYFKKVKPPQQLYTFSAEEFIKRLAEQINTLPYPVPMQFLSSGEHLLEVDPFDVHFGKYCWADETVTDFDLNIAAKLFKDAIIDLVQKSISVGVDRVLFVVGNDALHMDNSKGQTFGGTQMDVDTRFAKVFMRAHELHSWAIRYLKNIAPVDVIVVPGNHDTTASWHLGHVLSTEFANDPAVTVNNTTHPRKYYKYGRTLLGFTHGDRGKLGTLPLLMAREEPTKWASTEWREWHIGHLHKYSAETYSGVVVRRLNSITAHDYWHTVEGYTSQRGMQAFLHHHDTGLTAILHSNIEHKTGKVAVPVVR
jgi:AcrR family transcriptional regulator